MINELAPKPQSDNMRIGDTIIQFVNDRDFSSVRVRPGHINRLKQINSIIIVGSSGVGKSTMGRELRSGLQEAQDIVTFPKRITTRASREDDDLTEGYTCSGDEFMRLIEDDQFAIHWIRRDTPDRYGMLKPDSGKFPIFVTASAVVNNDSLQPKEILNTALLVAIYAPDTIKNDRIVHRSPDIDATDLRHRFKDRAIGIYPKIDILIKNFGKNETNAARDLLELTNFVVNNRVES